MSASRRIQRRADGGRRAHERREGFGVGQGACERMGEPRGKGVLAFEKKGIRKPKQDATSVAAVATGGTRGRGRPAGGRPERRSPTLS